MEPIETKRHDAQLTELLGRTRLIDELFRAGLEVAVPARDRGVDLIAYADLHAQVGKFVARPLQMKAATKETFAINRKYSRIRDLIMVYVWHVRASGTMMTFALDFEQAVEVATKMGYTKSSSWAVKGWYSTSAPSPHLKELLKPYAMNAERWWSLVVPANRKDEIQIFGHQHSIPNSQ